MAKAIGRTVGQPDIKIRPAPWLLFRLSSPFSAFLHELLEMRCLWRTPVKLDNRKLVALIGDEPRIGPLRMHSARCWQRLAV